MEPIKKLFQAKVFTEFGEKKSEIDTLQNQLLNNIPDKMQSEVKVINRVGEILVLEVSSNSQAHKIKMLSKSILDKINSNSALKLKKIKIKISIQNIAPKRKVNKTSISSVNPMEKLSNEINNSPLKVYLKEIFKNKK